MRNGAAYLGAAIRSALAQTRPADEILLLDDGSTDATPRIARDPQWQGRVRYAFNDEPNGWANAFNRVAELSTGAWVVILCADDLLCPTLLEQTEAALNANPDVGLCYCGCRYIRDTEATSSGPSPSSDPIVARRLSGEEYASAFVNGIYTDRPIHRFAGVAVRRDLWVDRCRVRPEAGVIADTDFFLRLAALSDAVSLAQPLAIVRVHPDSVTSQLESLSLQLASDYLFQARYNATSRSALDAVSIDRIHRLAASYTTQLLIDALRRMRPDWIRRAKEIRAELDSYVPDRLWREIPTRSRIIWALALHDRVDLLSRVLGIIRSSARPILHASRSPSHPS